MFVITENIIKRPVLDLSRIYIQLSIFTLRGGVMLTNDTTAASLIIPLTTL